VDHRRHRHAEHGRTIVRYPRTLGYIPKVLHPRQIVQRSQVALVIQRQRGVKRPAGDQVPRRAPFQLGVERRIVFRRRIRRKHYFYIRIMLVERRDDRVLPYLQIVIPPTLNRQGHFLG